MADSHVGKINRDNLIALLENLGIDIEGETSTEIIAYCPFHHNKNTPAFNISKETPFLWRCWNSKCGESGTLIRLVQNIGGMTQLESLRYIYKYRSKKIDAIDQLLKRTKKEDYDVWPETIIAKTLIGYDNPIFDILYNRGFTEKTLRYFEIGYSEKQNRITIPVRDEYGNFVGFTGRATSESQEKKYWDKGLPKRFVLFNLNNAKRYEDCIIVEGPLDAMKVWQAGYPNTIAVLGGGFTGEQAKKLMSTFMSVIIFTDNDEAGRSLANKIEGVMRKAGKQVFYALYPEGYKDPGELSEEQIKFSIDNKISALENKIKEIIKR